MAWESENKIEIVTIEDEPIEDKKEDGIDAKEEPEKTTLTELEKKDKAPTQKWTKEVLMNTDPIWVQVMEYPIIDTH